MPSHRHTRIHAGSRHTARGCCGGRLQKLQEQRREQGPAHLWLSMQSAYRATLTPNRVRYAALFFPAAGISNQYFHRYWLHEHGKQFMSLDVAKKNLTKYEQFHFDNQLGEKFATAMGASTGGTAFWGMATFEAESWDKILEVFSHPEYERVVFPDERRIIDRARTQVFAGEFATMLDRGVQSKT